MSAHHTPHVTVIVPNYNGAQFLSDAIESVLAQTYRHIALIVVDDGSTDGSRDIVAQYVAQDARVRMVAHEQNRGVSAARNSGLAHATTPYVAFLDSDDTMAPTRLEKQVVHLRQHPESAAVGSWLSYSDAHGGIVGVKRYQSRWCGRDARALYTPLVSQSAVTVRRNVFRTVGTYDEALCGGEDYDLWLRMLSHGLCIDNIQEPLTTYRTHAAQGSMAHGTYQRGGFQVRWKYLWHGFFSVRGLVATLAFGMYALVPRCVRNTLRTWVLRASR